MLDWILIISLLGIGLLLLLVELFFIPGTTVVGFAGFGCITAGLYFAFRDFGTQTGGWLLLFTTVLGGLITFWGLRSDAWKRFALRKQLTEKVNTHAERTLYIGAVGKAISMLRPAGNAEFDGEIFEVHTIGEMLQVGSLVKVIKIEHYKIIVEPSN
ncbi:NfeD-like C-terminal, partner-binding [Flexibacter flexilis DSM 6793]|uniref:NfeD-like C-terminal, partner-binding n=1 Tax=Flexibacter flexilis DSM 6793 TaxID=927664 RepID=A0A1I1DTU8_9BACT|nr:NfeD family protein [Flexibacter flexilis]SFB78217.1 NfeD-like C-terminal, partner-binding [Flexibacter flexilis DSM 6793]